MPRTTSGSSVCGNTKYPSPRASRLRKKSAHSHQARRPLIRVSSIILLVEQPVAHDVVQGGRAVSPRDLLALGVGAPVGPDRHLVHATAGLADLNGHLRLEAEAVGPQRETLQHVGAERLV